MNPAELRARVEALRTYETNGHEHVRARAWNRAIDAVLAILAATEPSRDPSGVKHDPTECADCARIKGVVIAPHDLACGRSPGRPDPLCAACAATPDHTDPASAMQRAIFDATPDHTEGGDR